MGRLPRARRPRTRCRLGPSRGLQQRGAQKAALSTYTSKDIVLQNGVYDSTEPFDNYHGNRLYAETLGQAVLKAGIILGGSWGPGGGVVRGVAFDVTAESKTLQGSLIHVWGTGANWQILDATLKGHMTISAASSRARWRAS